jgi:glycosyltransferase involved in cell wall biosynthesis
MEGNGKTVCMISCLHPLKDDRIYWKESLSLQKYGYKVIHIGVSDKEYDEISEQGIRLISIKKKQFFKNPFIDKFYRTISFQPNIYTDIFNLAKELKADVYHFHDYQINRIGRKLKNLSHQPKVIYDVHEPYSITVSTTTSKNIFVKLFWLIYGVYLNYWELMKSKKYDLILTTEENVQQRFSKKLLNIPVEIIYNYVDIEPVYSAEKKYDFIYCGGIRRRRGIFEILKAVNILNQKQNKLRVLLIGNIHDKGLEKEIRNFIKINNLEDCVDLIPAVPYSEVFKYYSISKIGLAVFNDKKVNRTIMPIKIFEYIVCGLPVITSNFGHMKTITLENNTGILIDPKSTEQLVEKMEMIISNVDFYNRMSNNCFNSRSKYLWKHMENKLISVYAALLS